jgi:hypothetical protein
LTLEIVSRRATAWAKVIGALVASDAVALPASPVGRRRPDGWLVATEGGQAARHLSNQGIDLLVQKIDVGLLHGQQMPMMGPYQSGQSLIQQRNLPPHPLFGQLRHGGRAACLSTTAAKLAPAETPMMSVATAANLMFARSSTPCT